MKSGACRYEGTTSSSSNDLSELKNRDMGCEEMLNEGLTRHITPHIMPLRPFLLEHSAIQPTARVKQKPEQDLRWHTSF